MFVESHVTYELSVYIIMPKIKERDEQEALKLDEYYKRTLLSVRPYISNLKSLEEAYLCKIWFDKLNATISQRNLRNEYLLELSRQLKAGTLEGIFRTQPPDDLLKPLPSSCHAVFCIKYYSYIYKNRKIVHLKNRNNMYMCWCVRIQCIKRNYYVTYNYL